MNKKELTNEDGAILVRTARKIVTEWVTNGKKISLDEKFTKFFSFDSGVFVTLNKNSNLRGCIGFPLPEKKLHAALFDAAIAASCDDPRFNPVSKEELNEITFEITVLTPPIKIIVDDPIKYLDEIKIGRDGLIVKHSFYSGLLLPQVPVEYNWNTTQFLEFTCEKAGLQKNIWKEKPIELYKFEGIIFKETTPHGNIQRQYHEQK